ncbi:MAG: hypothetical protein ACOZDD_00755 [Bacteroidota bacterium]
METIKSVFTVLALATAILVHAGERTVMNVIPIEGEKVLVAFSSQNNDRISLSISDQNGRVVYYKSTLRPTSEFRALYDLSYLEDGEYTFRIAVNDTKISRKVNLSGDRINVGEALLNSDPVFALHQGKLDITYLNSGLEPVHLKIMQNNQVVFDTRLGSDFVIQNRYNLSGLPEGHYNIILEAGNEQYNYYADL